ncbi:MAG: GNAT family N-acetyltransferase [Defluviitaleaceae bacterium]|nr:GNAT family N-acetyltransferase [Defluviitaleaceae bacterium]
MNIEIKPLTPGLVPAYLDYFDNRAFSDGNPNGPCYCASPSMDEAAERRMIGEFGDDVKGTVRRYAVKMLAEGKIHGYLAFDGNTPAGWCNAGDMDGYASRHWIPDFARQNACGRTMSVVCFCIAPGYRGQGVSVALLESVCADAKAGGFAAAEGYCMTGENREYHGPERLFEKAGFVEAARQDNRVVMRKIL